MKKKAFGFLFSLIAAVLSLCVCLPKNSATAFAASVENSKQAYFLLDDNAPYESTIEAGTASGYNEYLLGETDIEPISAQANAGFYIAGWRIVFSEVGATAPVARIVEESVVADNQSIFKANSFTVTYQANTGNFNVDYVISYEDLDGDGKVEKSTITTSQIVENVVIDPVFDYIYTNVEITDFMSLTDLSKYNRLTVADTTEILYKTRTTLADATQFGEAILLKGGKFYFYGDIYNADGTNFYTLNTRSPKLDDGKTTQKIDIDIGRFRLGENVEFNFDVDVQDDLTTGKNIDLQSVALNYVDLTGAPVEEFLSNEGQKTYSVVKDEFLRTKQIGFNIAVPNSQNHNLLFTPTYHNLYIATITTQLSGVATTENYILNALSIPTNNYFSKIDDYSYFVKNPIQSGVDGFKVTANKIVQNLGYNYYQFDQITSTLSTATISENNLKISGQVDQNFEVAVNYLPIFYKVDFKFAILDQAKNLIKPLSGSFNVESEIYLERGKSSGTISKTASITNVGYTFVGFINEENTTNLVINDGATVNTTTTISIDETRPTNKTIYMLFVETEYSLRMNNLNNINLNDGLNTVYPISAMNMSVLRADNTFLSALQGLSGATTQSVFDQTIKLGDVITVNANLNRGFILLGFGYNASTKSFDGRSFKIELTQEFLSNYDNSSTTFIDMFDFEDFETYTFTYTLNGAPNGSGQNVLMADISVEYNGITYNKSNTTDTIIYGESGTDKAQIVLSNIKLYDKIKLIATAKSINDDGNAPYYLFTNFISNSTVFPLTSTSLPNSKAMVYTILENNAEVFAIYSMPGLRLAISIDDSTAIDLADSLAQGTTYLTDADNNTINFDAITLMANEELNPSKQYKLYLSNNFRFGYELVGYKYNGTLVETSEFVFSFTTLSTTQLHTIEIVTNAIHYQLNLSYAHSVDETPTLIDSLTITVSNLHIEFETPEGYYVAQVYFKNLLGMYRYQNNDDHQAECDNNYSSSIYTYNFTVDELNELIINYSTTQSNVVTLDMVFIYQLHTYEIKVKYSLVNSKGIFDQRVQFPNITGAADGEKIYYVDESDARRFFNIPYGAQVVLTAESNFEEGISPYDWVYNKLPGLSSNRSQFMVNKITSSQNVEYQLNYNSYTIKIEKVGNSQQPTVTILAPLSEDKFDKISKFDRLSIQMNADRNNGWRFANMYYYKTSFVPYVYDPETFDSTTLYLLTDGQYMLNTEPYNEANTYYEKQRVQVDFSAFKLYTYNESTWADDCKALFVMQGSEYKRNASTDYDETKEYYTYSNTTYYDNEFNISNYLPEIDANGVYSITFYCVYDYIDISFEVATSLVGFGSLERGDLSISKDDYADISFSKISKTNIETLLETSPSVVINDNVVKISIQLKTFEIDNNQVSLAAGVVLRQVFICDAVLGQLTPVDKGNGLYVVEFSIASMLENNCISQNDNFVLHLTYQITNKQMILTTNLKAEDFYMSKSGETIFSMGVDENRYGFGSNSSSSNGSTKLALTGNDSIQFLSKVYMSYMFVSPYAANYNQYFSITGLNIYNLDTVTDDFGFTTYNQGDLIKAFTTDELNRYGISNLSLSGQGFDYRFLTNLYIELVVEPIITINANNNRFTFTFNCDTQGNGIEQKLTIGQNSTFNIEIAPMLDQYDVVTYHKNIVQNGITIGYSTESCSPIDAGTYLVKIGFAGLGDWAWLSNLSYGKDVFLTIVPKEIELKINAETFSRKQVYEKVYEGKDKYAFDNALDLLNYIYITDGNRTYPYTEANDNLRLNLNKIEAKISYTNNDTQVYTGIASLNGKLHNIHLTGLEISNTNFKLKADNLLFEKAMKITPKEIVLDGVKVYDKVYDGTDKAEYHLDAQLKWLGVLDGDAVDRPNGEDLSLKFAKDANGQVKIGYNINIVIDASRVLKGEDADNYTIKVNGATANIYPYSVSTEIEGFGKIEVRNDKGLIDTINGTKHELANLIPIGAELKIEVVRVNTPEYVAIYPNISRYLNRNHNFAVGYKISFETNNITTSLSNNLTLVLPTVARLTNTLMLTNNGSVQLDYVAQDGSLVIDLSQTNYAPYTFALVQQRVLLKSWQLILIISLAALVLAVVIIVFVVVRKRKKQRYSLNEKI